MHLSFSSPRKRFEVSFIFFVSITVKEGRGKKRFSPEVRE